MNVIVICMDTLRADIVEHTWQDRVDIPNLDALRASSVVFTSAWAEGEPTIPTRRSFFTGMRSYPWRYHIDDRGSSPNLFGWHAIPTEQTTLAEYAAAQGVCTGLIADTWHLFKPTMNFTRGFAGYEFIRGQEGDALRTGPIEAVVPLLRKYLPDEIANLKDRGGVAKYLLNVLDRHCEEDYFAPRVFRAAARWLRDNVGNQPFFLWIDSFTPHEFWDPPVEFADRYFAKPGVRDFIYPQMVQSFRKLTDDEVRRTKALYYGYITFADKWVGHFLQTLTDLNLWRNTVVILTSDHGTELMDKGQFGKSARALHPYNTRIPLWIRHPNRRFHGKKCHAFVQTHDLFPTVLRFLNVRHDPVDGQDIWPLATGQTRRIREEVIMGWMEWASVRTKTWNLIVNTVSDDPQPRLFAVRDDPDEQRNLAARYPDVVAELQAKLEELIGTPLPARYVHQPTGKYNVGFRELALRWHESNIS